MTALFSSPPTPKVSPPPPTPTREDPEVEEARRRQIRQSILAKGRLGTINTSGAGVGGQAPVKVKSLLGE